MYTNYHILNKFQEICTWLDSINNNKIKCRKHEIIKWCFNGKITKSNFIRNHRRQTLREHNKNEVIQVFLQKLSRLVKYSTAYNTTTVCGRVAGKNYYTEWRLTHRPYGRELGIKMLQEQAVSSSHTTAA